MKIKLVVLIIILTGFFGSAFSQIKLMEESDLEIKKRIEEFIVKDIVSATTYRYDVDSGVVGTEPEKISKNVIDLNNRIFTMLTFYPNYSRTIISFNEKNDITDIVIYYSDNSVMSRIKTNYGKDMNVEEKIYYFGNSYTFKIKNIRKSGNIISQEYLDSLGKKLNYSKLFYDNQGRLIQEDKYNFFDSLEISYSYLYDENGNNIEESVTYPSSNIISRTTKKYNSENRVTEKIYYSNGSKISSRNVLEYDEKGRLKGDYSYAIDDKPVNLIEFIYDEKGLITQWKFSDRQEDIEYLYKIVYNEK
jgi:hypothetical protein